MTYTATRTTKSGSTTIVVTDEAGTVVGKLGGARAARAAAVIAYNPAGCEPLELAGCRADLAAAEAEAHRMATATSFRHGGGTFPCTPNPTAHAIPVVDA